MKWLLHLLQPNRQLYYDKYFGSDAPWLLLIKNLLRPNRLFTRWRYGQLRPPLPLCYPLIKDGIQRWPYSYSDMADAINRIHPLIATSNGYQGVGYIPMDHALLDIVLDDSLLYLLFCYFNRHAYLREPVHHSIALPSENQKHTRLIDVSAESFNVGWHYDTPNLVQLIILLNDVTEHDSHLQVARGEHRRWRVNLGKYDYYYSDEYADAHFEVEKCIGPKGTAWLFDTNAPHRFFMVKDSLRAMVKIGYTPGNDILIRKHPDHEEYRVMIPDDYQLTPTQQEAVRLAR